MKQFLVITLLLLFNSIALTQIPDSTRMSNDSLGQFRRILNTSEKAIGRALAYSGIKSRLQGRNPHECAHVEKIFFNEDKESTESDKIIAREVWRVTFERIDFRRPLLLDDSNVTNLRDIEIFLDSKSGQLLRIRLSTKTVDTTPKSELTADSAKQILRNTGEVIQEYSEIAPEYTFIEAVFAGIACSPWAANEITARLIINSKENEESKVVWSFTCSGLTIPWATFGGTFTEVRCARCEVDATTGQWIFVSSCR